MNVATAVVVAHDRASVAFANAVVSRVAHEFGLDDPERVAATIVAVVRSTVVTAYALLLFCVVTWWATVPDHTPASFLAFVRANALGWMVANVFAPAWRAADAWIRSKAAPGAGNAPPPP